MNIESILEDIETQGYFQTKPSIEPATAATKFLEITTSSSRFVQLSAPLQGRDFISGFDLNAKAPIWYLFPISQVSNFQLVPRNSELLQSKLKLEQLIKEKLSGIQVRVQTSEKVFSGQISKLVNSVIELTGEDNIYLPLLALHFIAVEKINQLV